MLTRSRSKVRRSKVRRSRGKVRRSRSKVSRGKVRRSRSKVRRSKVRRSKVRRSKVRRSKVRRSKVRRSKVRYDGLNFANDSVIISNEDIKKATEGSNEFGMTILNGDVIKIVTSNLERPYKIEYRKYDTGNKTYTYETINSKCEQVKITEALTNPNRGDRDVIVKSAIFDEGVVFNNDNKLLMITGKIINYSKDNNKIDQLKSIIEYYLKLIYNPVIRFEIKGTRKDYTKKLSKIDDIDKHIIRFITKENDYIKIPCKIEDILDAFNDEMRGEFSNIFVYPKNESSLINKISTYTKISVPNLKIILGGFSAVTLAGIALYLSQNKNMSKEEMKNYLVQMVNKNKK